MEHEHEMNRLKEQENGDIKARGLALKSVALDETSKIESSEDNEIETLNILTGKFSKFLRNERERQESINKEVCQENLFKFY